MKSVKISNEKIPSLIEAPSSKSYANRALILGALSPKAITIQNLPQSRDVDDLILNLKEIGLDIDQIEDQVTIKNNFPTCEKKDSDSPIMLSGSEGGTTIRFLITLLSMGQNEYILKLKARMKERPLSEQSEQLNRLGAVVEINDDQVKIQGPIDHTCEVEVDCSETTQFASSLYLVSSVKDILVKIKNLSFSSLYIEMTKNLVREFSSPYIVPADFSSLSYIAAYGFLNQDLEIKGVSKIDTFQADAKLFNYVEQLGGTYKIENDQLFIYESQLAGRIEIDVRECLDLFPTLIYLAMFSDAEFVFKNLGPLKFKESDRVAEMIKLLEAFNARFSYDETSEILKIEQSDLKKPEKSPNLPNDHRIVMSFTLMLKHMGGGKVEQYQAVEKSFGNFFEYFR